MMMMLREKQRVTERRNLKQKPQQRYYWLLLVLLFLAFSFSFTFPLSDDYHQHAATAFQTTTTTSTTNSRYITTRRPRKIKGRHHNHELSSSSSSSSSSVLYNNSKDGGLNIVVVGGGPSGLLLCHLLLLQTQKHKYHRHRITLIEGRSDPRRKKKKKKKKIGDQRAYALGIGIRGRTAIRTADNSNTTLTSESSLLSSSSSSSSVDLWNAVKSRGYESERFRLHLNLLPIINKDLVLPLRSEQPHKKKQQQNNDDDDDDSSGYDIEPSLLISQSELCLALLEELELRYLNSNQNDDDDDDDDDDDEESTRLKILFDTKFIDCDYDTMRINIVTKNENEKNEEGNELLETTIGPKYDLIIGCDGVNSQVRNSMDTVFPDFSSTKDKLPGLFKVVRLHSVPTKDVDPTAVSLLLPSGAFIEPTDPDGGCCILFSSSSGNGKSSSSSNVPLYLTETKNITAVVDALRSTFPTWDETSYNEIATQLVSQTTPNSAYAVQCNTYHYKNKAVLVGDAAHATGGVSGQGVNSALVDSVVLAECIQQYYCYDNKEEEEGKEEKDDTRLEHALMNYSIRQLPEGKALYDLSFGPNPKGIKNKLKWGFKNMKDAVFRGKYGFGSELPLQTRLSTELTSFAEIRRARDEFYRKSSNDGDDDDDDDDDESQRFPSDQEFRQQLMLLHRQLGNE